MKKGVVLIGLLFLSVLSFRHGHAATLAMLHDEGHLSHIHISSGIGGNGAFVGQTLPFGNDRPSYLLEFLGLMSIILASGLLYKEALARFVRKIRAKELDEVWLGAYCPVGKPNVVCTSSVCNFIS